MAESIPSPDILSTTSMETGAEDLANESVKAAVVSTDTVDYEIDHEDQRSGKEPVDESEQDENVPQNLKVVPQAPINRDTVLIERACPHKKVCPFLVRVYCTDAFHRHPEEYASISKSADQDVLYVHSWRDATLRELTTMIQRSTPAARHANARLSFRIIYHLRNVGRFNSRDIGTVMAFNKDLSVKNRYSADETIQLCNTRFEIGDFLEVAITNGNKLLEDRRLDTRFKSREQGPGGILRAPTLLQRYVAAPYEKNERSHATSSSRFSTTSRPSSERDGRRV